MFAQYTFVYLYVFNCISHITGLLEYGWSYEEIYDECRSDNILVAGIDRYGSFDSPKPGTYYGRPEQNPDGKRSALH